MKGKRMKLGEKMVKSRGTDQSNDSEELRWQ